MIEIVLFIKLKSVIEPCEIDNVEKVQVLFFPGIHSLLSENTQVKVKFGFLKYGRDLWFSMFLNILKYAHQKN